MGVWYICNQCGQGVTHSGGEPDHHEDECPAQQPLGPSGIGLWWLIALAGLVLACCLWGSS